MISAGAQLQQRLVDGLSGQAAVVSAPRSAGLNRGLRGRAAGAALQFFLTTLSGNAVSSDAGIYIEDYFFNFTLVRSLTLASTYIHTCIHFRCAARGGQYLNQFNGHDHDHLGFHYHLSVDDHGAATFPYGPSLQFYGCTSRGSGGSGPFACRTSQCGASSAAKPSCVSASEAETN